jgi:hypothetical protein
MRKNAGHDREMRTMEADPLSGSETTDENTRNDCAIMRTRRQGVDAQEKEKKKQTA